jgi:hypothetical protein
VVVPGLGVGAGCGGVVCASANAMPDAANPRDKSAVRAGLGMWIFSLEFPGAGDGLLSALATRRGKCGSICRRLATTLLGIARSEPNVAQDLTVLGSMLDGPRAPGQRRTPHLDPRDAERRLRPRQVDANLSRPSSLPSTPRASFARISLATAAHGTTLRLPRAEARVVATWLTTLHPGGGSLQYDPLPARLGSRGRLRFVYFEGRQRSLAFTAMRQAARETGVPD